MSPVRRVLRILSTALITAGVVVLLDVAVTLAWEEPVSSLYAAVQQQRAESELEEVEDSFDEGAPSLRGLGDVAAARRLARAFEGELEEGRAMGRIVVPELDLDAVIVEGTDTGTLQKGPGHYPETGLPGQGRMVGVAGHRTTYLAPFRHIDRLQRGDRVVIKMPYGDFTYEVERTRIVEPTDVGIVRDTGEERIVLTACHPLYSAAQRYAVFARLVGVKIDAP